MGKGNLIYWLAIEGGVRDCGTLPTRRRRQGSGEGSTVNKLAPMLWRASEM